MVGHKNTPAFLALLLYSAIATISGALALQAQATAQPSAPAFDVASVKASQLEIFGGGPYFFPGGRFRVNGGTLRLLVAVAYSYDWGGPLAPYEILDGPSWIDSRRFDIEANGRVGDTADPLALLRLKALLEDRFKLRVHLERRERPVFALVKARGDGQLGPHLRPSVLDCSNARDGLPPPPVGSPADDQRCTLTSSPGRLVGRGVELSQLARRMASLPMVARWVLERSGLSGRYDFELEWAPTVLSSSPASTSPDFGGDFPDADHATLFTAVQEQLGLRLQSEHGTVKVLVIDAAEMPTPN